MGSNPGYPFEIYFTLLIITWQSLGGAGLTPFIPKKWGCHLWTAPKKAISVVLINQRHIIFFCHTVL